jgi:hypothetical protein
MLLLALVLPGTNARSGMKAPNGTPMNRLLSTSHAEQFCAYAPAELITPSPATAIVAKAPTSFFIATPHRLLLHVQQSLLPVGSQFRLRAIRFGSNCCELRFLSLEWRQRAWL